MSFAFTSPINQTPRSTSIGICEKETRTITDGHWVSYPPLDKSCPIGWTCFVLCGQIASRAVPKAIAKPVRDFVHSLYLQGVKTDTIAQEAKRQYNAVVCPNLVLKWADRYGWKAVQAITRTTLEKRVTEPILTGNVAKQGQSVREQLAQSLAETGNLLSKRPLKGLKGALAVQAALEPMVRNANKVFGWDQQSSSTIASVQSLSSELPVLDQIDTKTVANTVASQDLPAQLPENTG